MKKFFARLTPAARLALGLVSLAVTVLLLSDIALNLVPNQADMHRKIRESTSERLAVQIASLLQMQEWDTLRLTLNESVARDKDILSLAVRQQGGKILFSAGDHLRYWTPETDGQSTLTHVRVPINDKGTHWGDVEISYRPVTPQTLKEWLQIPLVALALVVAPLTFLAFYLYVRRALQYLDPASAVPDRVRIAFDVLAEGVVVVDRAGNIMLSNKAFHSLHPTASVALMGKPLSQLAWLIDPQVAADSPWEAAMRNHAIISGHHLTLTQPDGSICDVIVNAAPILDGPGQIRGCIVTFSDMTQLHRLNQQLRDNLVDLETSRAQIEEKNEELRLLATRDPLTGCLNRRAFVSAAEPLLEKLVREAHHISCIMADIDFFKKVNDTYGHTVGDHVIVSVARALSGQIRAGDLLCRYGGEEFCIILPGAPEEVAAEVAERIRAEVEKRVGLSIRNVEGLHVTCSLGVSSMKSGANNLLDLIELADIALYSSKENGRNRVTLWTHVFGKNP